MKRQQLKLAALVFGLGLLGVFSILTMKIPLPEETIQKLLEKISEDQLRLAILINPAIMLLFSTIIGAYFYKKAGFKVPILENIAGEKYAYDLTDIIKTGVLGGLIAGVALSVVGAFLIPSLPEEFVKLSETIKPSLPARFLYGGITEEILMRFGLMSVVVWVISKITGSLNSASYWIGIAIVSLIFAAAHLPIVFQTVANPSKTLYAYIILGNTIGGVIFGWLYWKKGLEAAMIGHIFAHVAMVAGEQILNLG